MLTNFRSYAALDLTVGVRSVVLTGPNGAGKTNLLEAISMLSPGRGLRGVPVAELARRSAGPDKAAAAVPWAVGATLNAGEATRQLGAGYMPGGEGQAKRIARIDGIDTGSASAFADHMRIVWLTPAQDRLFADAPSERRRFLDRLIGSFEPRHMALWSSYEKAMRERAGLLRLPRPDPDWLTACERAMAEHAVALAAARRDGVARLAKTLEDRDTGSAFPAADLALDGIVETALDTMPALAAEDRFAENLARNRAMDAEAGRTKSGPHATDMVVRHRAKDRDARQCSTGEQKALMIRLVLAGAQLAARKHGGAPILLLDEIAAHLDERRRFALFDEIARLGAQAWYTGTDEQAFEALGGRATAFRVVPSGDAGASTAAIQGLGS
jgi:DNA replication and repair protein RecF